jgi:hypothetical protein
MPRTSKVVVLLLLSLLGLAGLLRLPLLPPPVARTSADTTLSDLEAQESLQEVRQQAAAVMSRFVGGEITRHYWGGFTPFMDVLGIEIPPGFESNIDVNSSEARLSLRPRRGLENYLAEVRISNNVARGVACRGVGRNPTFRLIGERLLCPEGWIAIIDPSVDGYRK